MTDGLHFTYLGLLHTSTYLSSSVLRLSVSTRSSAIHSAAAARDLSSAGTEIHAHMHIDQITKLERPTLHPLLLDDPYQPYEPLNNHDLCCCESKSRSTRCRNDAPLEVGNAGNVPGEVDSAGFEQTSSLS